MDPDEAAKLYLRRIESKIPVFETMNENELNYVKMINAGRAFFYNNLSFNVRHSSDHLAEGASVKGFALCSSLILVPNRPVHY